MRGSLAGLAWRWTELCNKAADCAGGDWPQVAQASSSAETAERQRNTESNVHMAAMADAVAVLKRQDEI
eukprot:CAMPEP_0114658974 /NCGR_PEP_ID=MMETSP0191-20121206/16814_1 /TAXON_ID=126664 /ORGANISM="Sorites sp." /LENGTH=68 /DNA_ID=CAMNT_0001882593 /DNA_START=1055 /DNA_END=1261 /DNA_ORIENTATION=-